MLAMQTHTTSSNTVVVERTELLTVEEKRLADEKERLRIEAEQARLKMEEEEAQRLRIASRLKEGQERLIEAQKLLEEQKRLIEAQAESKSEGSIETEEAIQQGKDAMKLILERAEKRNQEFNKNINSFL